MMMFALGVGLGLVAGPAALAVYLFLCAAKRFPR